MHRRYVAACERGERPDVDDPRVLAALLTPSECVALARIGYYPPPTDVIRLGMTLAEYRQQQILAAVAEQMPDAINAILETTEI